MKQKNTPQFKKSAPRPPKLREVPDEDTTTMAKAEAVRKIHPTDQLDKDPVIGR